MYQPLVIFYKTTTNTTQELPTPNAGMHPPSFSSTITTTKTSAPTPVQAFPPEEVAPPPCVSLTPVLFLQFDDISFYI
jgi:hypothetical protein